MSLNLYVEHASGKDLHTVWASCTEIAKSMAYPSFFCSGDWLRATSENLRSDEELFILLIMHDGCVRAVLPLVKKRNSLGGNDLRYLGSDFYPDPLGLISSLSDRAACATVLQDYLLKVTDWDRLILNWILEDELKDWNISGKQISVAPFKILPRNITNLLGEFKQKKRYNLRSIVKKFFDAGGEFAISLDMNSNRVFLDTLFTLHAKRASEKCVDSSFDLPSVRTLHRNLVAQSACVRFYGLKLHNHLIAVIYGFEFCNRFFYYQVAHDPHFGHLSPGSVLLFLVIENCCERGVMEFNFLQGDESYKGVWTHESRVLYRSVLTRNTWRSHVFDILDKARDFCKGARAQIIHGA